MPIQRKQQSLGTSLGSTASKFIAMTDSSCAQGPSGIFRLLRASSTVMTSFRRMRFGGRATLLYPATGFQRLKYIYIYMWGRTREGGQALLKTQLRSVSTKDKGIEKVRASFIKLFFTESKSHPNRSASTEDDVGGILQARSPIFAVSPELPSLLPRSDSLPPLVSELQPHMFLLNRGGPEHQIESYTAVMGACVGVYI